MGFIGISIHGGVPKSGVPLCGPHNNDDNIWASTLVSPYVGKLPCIYIYTYGYIGIYQGSPMDLEAFGRSPERAEEVDGGKVPTFPLSLLRPVADFCAHCCIVNVAPS